MMIRLLMFWLVVLTPALGHATDGANSLDADAVIAELSRRGDDAINGYVPESGIDAVDTFSGLYFDVFEASGLETAIGMQNPALKTELESMFGEIIGLAGQGAATDKVEAAWLRLRNRLNDEVRALLGTSDSSFAGLLLQAFLILLREGFEAMLVVMALSAYLRRTETTNGMSALYGGVALALLASVATVYGLKVLFEASGAAREALEGITMLVAAAVLIYVSQWLLARRQAHKWQAYIQSKMDRAVSAGQLWALGFTVFLAVYREGAETILFFYALAGQADHSVTPLALGFVAGTLALAALYLVMKRASLKLPLPVFFSITAALLFYLAFSFAGTGILELQEAGWIAVTPAPAFPRITWLGMYPTLETLLAQAVVLMPLLLTAVWLWYRRQALQGKAGL